MRYYVNRNAQRNGDHEVHRSYCGWLPDAANRIDLGECAKPQEALWVAHLYYDQVDGCAHCCPEIHHR